MVELVFTGLPAVLILLNVFCPLTEVAVSFQSWEFHLLFSPLASLSILSLLADATIPVRKPW